MKKIVIKILSAQYITCIIHYIYLCKHPRICAKEKAEIFSVI